MYIYIYFFFFNNIYVFISQRSERSTTTPFLATRGEEARALTFFPVTGSRCLDFILRGSRCPSFRGRRRTRQEPDLFS